MHFTNSQPLGEGNDLLPFFQRPSGSLFSPSPVWNSSSWLSSLAAALRSSHGATLHAAASIVAAQELSLEGWFNMRADRWERETGIHSSPVIRFMYKYYQSIMARGKDVIPYILNRMKKKPDDWFWALRHLADDYDAASDANSFDGAVSAWLKWGVENDYISE